MSTDDGLIELSRVLLFDNMLLLVLVLLGLCCSVLDLEDSMVHA